VYENWTPVTWETPVSHVESLAMVSLVDDGELRVTLEDARSSPRRRWRFTFYRSPMYQNVLEEYREELWARIRDMGLEHCWTRTVPDSAWLAALKEREPWVDILEPGLIHYQIATEDDVLDIACASDPMIVEIEPASADEPPAGKSTVFHMPEDRAAMDALTEEIQGLRKPNSERSISSE